jgi:hypothetical protein
VPINEWRNEVRKCAADVVISARENMQLSVWQQGSQALANLHGTDRVGISP